MTMVLEKNKRQQEVFSGGISNTLLELYIDYIRTVRYVEGTTTRKIFYEKYSLA